MEVSIISSADCPWEFKGHPIFLSLVSTLPLGRGHNYTASQVNDVNYLAVVLVQEAGILPNYEVNSVLI